MRVTLVAVLFPVLFLGSGPIAPGPSLREPRAAHTATLLQSGQVLVAGGCTVESCELSADGATTELYDPGENRFEPGPRMTRPRVGHTATRLPGGNVLIAGGWDGPSPTATAELYEAATGRFVRVGQMQAARGGAVAALLPGGRVLIVGGTSGGRLLRSAEIYDSQTRAFVAARPMSTARGGHAAVRLPGGKVLVVGGSDRNERVLASAELFDARTLRFTRVGPMKTARHKHAVVALPGGRALVLGGSNELDFRGRYASAEVFSLSARRFVRVGRMLGARFKIDGSAVPVGRGPRSVLIAGGGEEVEVYRDRGRRFVRIGATGARLSFATATKLADGTVLFAGGYDDDIHVSRRAWLIRP